MTVARTRNVNDSGASETETSHSCISIPRLRSRKGRKSNRLHVDYAVQRVLRVVTVVARRASRVRGKRARKRLSNEHHDDRHLRVMISGTVAFGMGEKMKKTRTVLRKINRDSYRTGIRRIDVRESSGSRLVVHTRKPITHTRVYETKRS